MQIEEFMYNEIQHLYEELGKLKAENQRLKEDDETACRTEEHHRQAMTSSADCSQTLFNECQTLREQLSAAQERGDRFIEKCNVYRRTISEMKAGGIKADMFDILCQMEKYEYSRDEIFAAFSAFEMFLQKQNTEK